MKYTAQQYAEALFSALQETSAKDHDKVIENFVQVLKGNGDLHQYEKIVEVYEELDRKERGVAKAEVTVAHDIDITGPMISKLNEIAKQKLEISGSVDESLIGGVVIKIEDTLIDASVKGHLDKLRNILSN